MHQPTFQGMALHGTVEVSKLLCKTHDVPVTAGITESEAHFQNWMGHVEHIENPIFSDVQNYPTSCLSII
jgi:predicted TIM-barrel enzyme